MVNWGVVTPLPSDDVSRLEKLAVRGYGYSQFCLHYRQFQRHLDVVMRQEHRAGEKCFVDFAGQTIPLYDRAKRAVIDHAELFVAVLGASNYLYAEALPSQGLPHWIAAHVHAFEFFGAVPKLVVPDNLRSGVTRATATSPRSTSPTRRWPPTTA